MKLAQALPLVLLFLVACGEENRTSVTFSPSAERNATSTNDTTPRPAPVASPRLDARADTAPPPATAAMTATFARTRQAGGQAPGGSASLSPAGAGMTRVDVSLSGLLVDEHYAGAVRTGSCGRIGAFVAGLNPVSTGPSGAGRAATDPALPIDSLGRTPHVLVYGRDGRVELCATLGGEDRE